MIRRFHKRPIASLAVCVTALMLAMVGCRGGSLGSSDDEELAPARVAMSVTAARVEIAPIRNEIQLLGITAASRHLMLRAPAAGRVFGLDLQSGDVVRRGEVVARLLNREVEAVESGLAIARQLDPAEAPGLTSSTKRYVKGTGIPVIAPEDAIVAQRLVSSGQLVGDLDALADLIDPRSIFIEAAVPVDVLPSIRPGMKATVTSRLRPQAEFAARVAAIAPSFSPGGGSVTARLKFTGPALIDEVGAPLEARVTTAYVPDAIVIPVAALFQNAADAGWYVFVAGADGLAHRTMVSVGIRRSDRAQITSGLTPRELVITSGGYALSDGLRVMLVQK